MRRFVALFRPQWISAIALLASLVPASANAGFGKPLNDLPERLGTGVLALDNDWSLLGLAGLVFVVGLLAVFHRRDRQK